jgi:hypothetical protein
MDKSFLKFFNILSKILIALLIIMIVAQLPYQFILTKIGAVSGSIAPCNIAANYWMQDDCRYEVLIKNLNSKICESWPENSNYGGKAWCYLRLSLLTSDKSMCDKSNNPSACKGLVESGIKQMEEFNKTA